MTDPSYRSQILVFTSPLIGNYGVPRNETPIDSRDVGVLLESKGIQCTGIIVQNLAEQFSHYEAIESLDSWCKRYGVPGITGVDTRAITTLLRDQGTTLGRIGVVVSFSGLAVYNEFAAWFPNRSGSEVVYLEQAFPRPKFFFPITFAVITVLLSFSASNSLGEPHFLALCWEVDPDRSG